MINTRQSLHCSARDDVFKGTSNATTAAPFGMMTGKAGNCKHLCCKIKVKRVVEVSYRDPVHANKAANDQMRPAVDRRAFICLLGRHA